eukprot:1615625-Rhodomonas_salina.3
MGPGVASLVPHFNKVEVRCSLRFLYPGTPWVYQDMHFALTTLQGLHTKLSLEDSNSDPILELPGYLGTEFWIPVGSKSNPIPRTPGYDPKFEKSGLVSSGWESLEGSTWNFQLQLRFFKGSLHLKRR